MAPEGAPLIEIRADGQQFLLSIEPSDCEPSHLERGFPTAAIAEEFGISAVKRRYDEISLLYVVTPDA
jgi:hypothetical protein